MFLLQMCQNHISVEARNSKILITLKNTNDKKKIGTQYSARHTNF